MRAKVVSSHLERRAIVYVRQSTAMQVFEHGESTKRQYALVDRARALGFDPASIEVIDEDLGKSGASTEGRSGFARLAHAVAHGEVGAVLAVEVSRLARSSLDWQRLLALCAVAQTVVVDEQAIYDPNDKDDKLLLDIKGTMSEAELHWLGLAPRRRAKEQGSTRRAVARCTDGVCVARGRPADGPRRVGTAGREARARPIQHRAERVGRGAVGS